MARGHAQGVITNGNVRSALPRQRFNLGFGDVGKPHAPSLPFGVIVNGEALDTQHLPYLGHDHPRMPARLAGEDLRERLLLHLGRLLIEIERRLPLDLRHMSGRVDRERHVEPVEGDSVEGPTLNMPPHEHGTFPSGRCTEKDARARHFTVTGFEVRSCQLPLYRHG